MKIIAISTRSVDYKSDAGIAKRRLYINGIFRNSRKSWLYFIFQFVLKMD